MPGCRTQNLTWRTECNQCKDQNVRAFTNYSSNHQYVMVAKAAVVARREEKVSFWIMVVLEKCSEVADTERNVTSFFCFIFYFILFFY